MPSSESQEKGLKLPVYMDYQATTPLDRRVLDAMMPYLTDTFGNPHSTSHVFGWEAAEAVERAREQVAALIGAEPRDIVFTSGATESNNLALKGVARAYGARRNHLITVSTEHKCVLESARSLEREGFAVTYLPVDADGLIDLDALAAAITERTVLISVMAVNNEIGVIQPLAEIGALAHAHGVLFHTDAAQGVGKIPLDVKAMNIDLMSISGHKIYGPKGVGALYRRRRIRLEPLFSGGGQEMGVRSGTLAPAQCVGLGTACALAAQEMEADRARIQTLSKRLLDGLRERLSGVRLNGHATRRWPGNLNLSFAGVRSDLLIAGLRDLAVSWGAACASAEREPSHVLAALGLADDEVAAAVRFGLGRFTSEQEIDFAIETVSAQVERLRSQAA